MNLLATPALAKALQTTLASLNLWEPLLAKAAKEFNIVESHELAAWLAQCAHESMGFKALRENMNYTVDGLLKTFARHRITEEECRKWGRTSDRPANQMAIANRVYAGRGGNGQPDSEDGWRYRGGGLIHLTHIGNYRAFEAATGIPVVAQPGLIIQPEVAARSAAWYWKANNLGYVLGSKGFNAVSRAINLGNWASKTPALHEKERYAKWEAVQGAIEAANRGRQP